METNAPINLVDITIDEVALEGLDGITLEALWKRLSQRLHESLPFPKTFMNQIWSICVSIRAFAFYELPEPREELVIFDRYEFIDPDIGLILEPDDVPPDIYPHCPINDVENGIIGSCSTYYTRKEITESVRELSFDDVIEKYGQRLVIVASQSTRDFALMGPEVSPTLELNVIRYCFLERVGRSRYHGEVTQGKLSLNALKEDPKSLFYHRKFLLRYKLITKQIHHQKSGGHTCNGSLVHLPRFFVERIPKLIFLAEQVIEVLRAKPDYVADYEEIKKKLQIENSIKKLFKTSFFQKMVKTDIRLPYRMLYPNAEPTEWQRKSNPTKERSIRVVQLVQPNVDIAEAWNKDEILEDDAPQEIDISNHKYSVPFLKQANLLVEESQSEGVNQAGFAKNMGLTRLQSRTFLRNLVKANMVATYMDDIGRQRLTKFVSKKFEKGSKMSKQFNKEMHKIKELTKQISTDIDDSSKSQCTEQTIFIEHKIIDSVVSEVQQEVNAKEKKDPQSEDKKETPVSEEIGGPTVSRIELARTFCTINRIIHKYRLNKYIVKYKCVDTSLSTRLSKKEEAKENDESKKTSISLSTLSNDESAATFYKNIKADLIAMKPVVTGKEVNDLFSFMEDVRNSEKKHITSITYRLLRRANMIIESVKKHQVIDDMTKLMKMIQEEEDKEGYDVKIDKKSLVRLLQRLAKDNLVKIIKLTLSANTRQKHLTFICDPSIDVEHTVIQSAVEQAKLKFCLAGFQKMKLNAKKQADSSELAREKLWEENDFSKLADKNVSLKQPLVGASNFQYDPKVARRYGYIPKFVRMQALHIFLYYLVYDHPGSPTISKEEQIQALRSGGFKITDELAAEFNTIYTREVGWKMFVPPLPKHSGWPQGWTLMCDVFLRMPLSIFMKIHFVPFVTSELDPYLNHPIRKHYLIKDLPTNMRNILLFARKYIFDVHQTVMKLCYIGLVQFGPQRLKEKDQVFIYINRHTELMDTTSSAPGYHKVEDKSYPVAKYHFDQMQVVEKYWYDMWNTCINTPLGGRLVVQGKDILLEDLTRKVEMLKAVAARAPEEAVELDTGFVPGDRKGAAGLDSACFAHLKRNWSWGFTKYPLNRQQNTSELKTHQREAYLSKIKAKPVKLSDSPGLRKVSDSIPITEHRRKVPLQNKVSETENEPKKFDIVNSKKSTKQKSFVRRVLPRKSKRKSRTKYDEIDYRALQRMHKLRVDWDPQEDKILLLCKVVMFYLCPNPRKQLVAFTAVRDVLRKYSYISYNKTSRACQRRLLYMCRKPQTVNSIALGVEEIKQDFFISKRFGGIVDGLKEECKNSHDFEKRVIESFKSLVDYVAKKYYDISEIRPKEPFLVPKTIQEFNIYYKLVYPTKPYGNRGFVKDIRSINDIHSATINSVIHSSMCCCKDRRSWAFQLFKVYQQYPELLLRNAMMKIRSDQMVTIKKNYICTIKKYGNCIPISSSQYQLSTSYIYKFQTKWPYDIFNETYNVFIKLIQWYSQNRMNNSTTGQNNGIEITPVNGGLVAAIHDYLTMGQMDFDIEIPNQIIMLDPRLQEKDETYFRIAQRYQDVLANLDNLKLFREPFLQKDQKVFNKAQQNCNNDKTDSALFDDNSNNAEMRLEKNDKDDDTSLDVNFKEGSQDAECKNLDDGKELSDCDDLNSDSDEDNKDNNVIKFQDGTKIILNKDDVEKSSIDEDFAPEVHEVETVTHKKLSINGDSENYHENSIPVELQPRVKRLKCDNDSTSIQNASKKMKKEVCKADLSYSGSALKSSRNKRSRVPNDEAIDSDRPLQKKAKLACKSEVVDNTSNEDTQNITKVISEEQSDKTEPPKDSIIHNDGTNIENPKGKESVKKDESTAVEGEDLNYSRVNNILQNVASEKHHPDTYFKIEDSHEIQKRYSRIALLRMKEELSDMTVSDSHHAHDYFVVNMFKMFYSLDLPKGQPSAGLENFQGYEVPCELVPLNLNVANELIRDINKFAVFPKDNISYSDYKKNIPKEAQSQKLANMDAIYKFVREKKENGATIQELIDKFEHLGEDLYHIVSSLTKNYLFLRCGVTTARYIHHRHADPWLIHSYKIYRLEREAVAPVPRGTMYSTDTGKFVNDDSNRVSESAEAVEGPRSMRETVLPKTLFDVPLSVQQQVPLTNDLPSTPPEDLDKDVSSNSDEEGTAQTRKRMQRKRTRLLPQKDISRSAKQLDFSTAEKIRVVIKPWVRIDGVLNRRVLDRMLGAVFTYCLTHPGISLPKVQTRFVPALQPFHTRELVEMLVKIGCLKKKRLQKPKVTLFSKPSTVRPDDSVEDWDVEENIYMEPTVGACVKFGIFLSTKMYNTDFMS